MMADGKELDEVGIEPALIASRTRRRKGQLGLLAFLMITCLTGGTWGIVGRQWLHDRVLKRATEVELAAFQGRWQLESPSPLIGGSETLLIITGDDFIIWPDSSGKVRVNVSHSPKTADFERHPTRVGPPWRMTCSYSFEGERLVLHLVGKSLPDGRYSKLENADSNLVAVRVR